MRDADGGGECPPVAGIADTAKPSASFTTNAPSAISSPSGSAADRLRPPTLLTLVFRLGVGAALGFYFFVVFCIARATLGGFGMSLGLAIKCVGATVVMGAFIVWLAPFLELPEIWYRHRLPTARLARGECPDCGYPRAPGTDRCAECGSDLASPPAWQFGARTVRLFAVVTAAAFIVGCGAAMAWIAADERAFEREAIASRGGHQRGRAWPMQFAWLVATDDGELLAPTIPIEGEIDPNWRPRGGRGGAN